MDTVETTTNVSDDTIESEMRELFGITSDDSAETAKTPSQDTTENTEETTNTTTQEPANSQEGATDSAPTNTESKTAPTKQKPAEDAQMDPEEKFNKSNSAFAQMRIQNKELSDLLISLAKASGQNPKNITEAQEILKEGLNKVVSKNRNIPEDVLREMEEDKNALAEMRKEQAKQKALAGFQQVKDLHGLSREDINKFADKLLEKQINPFEHPDIDLVKEYRSMYFNELIAAAKEQGVQEERARALKATNNSTTPSTQQGLPDNTGNQGNPIKTVADLDKFFESLK